MTEQQNDLLRETVEALHDLSRLVVIITERVRMIEDRMAALENNGRMIGSTPTLFQ